MPNPNLPINARYNTYIGARYVPKFADPTEWSSQQTYEPLMIVTHQGNSYTSKTFVPVGVDINNTTYWAVTGNYNAQVEAYRQETLQLQNTVEAQEPIISGTENTWNIGSTSWVESSTPTTLPTLLPAQGSIIVNGQLYIYETNDTDTGYVTQINLSNMSVVNRDEKYCGHGNGITVFNNNLFIIGTGQIFVYSITNNSLVYVGVYDCPYGQAIACGATANYIVFVGGGRISFCTFDSTNGLSIFASYPSYSLVTEYAPAYQGGYVYNGMFFIMSGTSKYVLLSGVQLSTMNNLFLVMCERPAVVNEPQSFTITQDIIYFVGTDGTNNYMWTAPTPRTLGLHYNSFNNREQPVLTERGATSKVIYVNLSTGNDVKGDGQNGNPFRTIHRAIKEMNLYYLEGISRSIAVTGSSSDMVVIESQHNLQFLLTVQSLSYSFRIVRKLK